VGPNVYGGRSNRALLVKAFPTALGRQETLSLDNVSFLTMYERADRVASTRALAPLRWHALAHRSAAYRRSPHDQDPPIKLPVSRTSLRSADRRR
jgi:hypothetical protein